MTLYHKVLKQKKHKPRDAVDGGGTTGSGEGDVSGATSARTSATTRHPKISVIPPTSNAGTAMSSMRSAASTMRTNEQSSSGLNTINQSMKWRKNAWKLSLLSFELYYHHFIFYISFVLNLLFSIISGWFLFGTKVLDQSFKKIIKLHFSDFKFRLFIFILFIK